MSRQLWVLEFVCVTHLIGVFWVELCLYVLFRVNLVPLPRDCPPLPLSACTHHTLTIWQHAIFSRVALMWLLIAQPLCRQHLKSSDEVQWKCLENFRPLSMLKIVHCTAQKLQKDLWFSFLRLSFFRSFNNWDVKWKYLRPFDPYPLCFVKTKPSNRKLTSHRRIILFCFPHFYILL